MARDTARPHSRRVRAKPVKPSRRSGGGGGGKSGCPLFLWLAFGTSLVALARLALIRAQIGPEPTTPPRPMPPIPPPRPLPGPTGPGPQ